jgi:methionine sulfoxide reductase heme-binding subunit
VRWVTVLGIALLAGYVAQAALGLEWSWLAEQQRDDGYKIVSGGVLAGYLLWQWRLRRRRLDNPIGAVRRHKLAGAFAPLVLYIHAQRFAYGYLLVLAFCYLATTGIGLAYHAVLHRRQTFAWWFVVHLATATLLLVLGGYHAVIAIAYE